MIVKNDSISDISYTTAKAYATIIDIGEGIEQHGHCWSTSEEPAIDENENKTENGLAGAAVSYCSILSGLLPGTRYYIRAYVQNSSTVVYSDNVLSFYTLSIGPPVITTGEVRDITTSSAIISGSLQNLGPGATEVLQHGHCWSSEIITPVIDNNENKTSLGSSDSTYTFESQLAGLSLSTSYYVRAYATNSAGTSYGNQISFTTSASLPTIITVSPSNIAFTSTQSGGNVISDGGAPITARGVCWSTSENPTLSNNYTTDGSGTGSFISNIVGLTHGTTYYIRAYATNNVGTTYGNELTFITKNIIVSWQKSLGGSINEHAYSIQQTNDGGYIIAGRSNSNDGDVSGNHGGNDCWIVKLNSTGELVWQNSFGGSGRELAYSIQQTTDGGYIFAGSSDSNDGDVSENKGYSDCWVVKINSTGDLDWQKCLGGSSSDEANSIQQTTDGGYIFCGYTRSNDGDVSENKGNDDYWIVKLSPTGEMDWQKSFGGSSGEQAFAIQQTTDGGYIIAGFSASNDGDVSGNHGVGDYWIVKLTSTGQLSWQKSFGGSSGEKANYIQQTIDGGYIIAGRSSSNDGDVSENKGLYHCWIVKLNSTGELVWQKPLGGSNGDRGYSIQQTTDGGYITAGYSLSNDGDVSGNHGVGDYWVLRLTSTGELAWQKCLGGSNDDRAYSIQQTIDGSFIIAGESYSNDFDVSGNHGERDYWIVKIIEN